MSFEDMQAIGQIMREAKTLAKLDQIARRIPREQERGDLSSHEVQALRMTYRQKRFDLLSNGSEEQVYSEPE